LKDVKSQQNVRGRRFPLKIVIASLIVLLVAIAGCYYVLTNWGMQVYTYSTAPSSDVTLGISINNTGRAALTILDSRDGMIKFTEYIHGSGIPRFFMQDDSERLYGNLRIDSNIRDFESFMYLPAGPSYNMTITCSDFKKIENNMVNKYTGGNLTLWVNDTVHGLYRYTGSK
jgi:hypothetical protein